MKNLKSVILAIMISTSFASCKSDKKVQPTTTTDNIIEVIAKDFTFTVDSVIPSGWSTFKMKNTGTMEHFFSY